MLTMVSMSTNAQSLRLQEQGRQKTEQKAKNSGFILMEYCGVSPSTFKCQLGHEWKAVGYKLSRCPECAKNDHIDSYREKLSSLGVTLINWEGNLNVGTIITYEYKGEVYAHILNQVLKGHMIPNARKPKNSNEAVLKLLSDNNITPLGPIPETLYARDKIKVVCGCDQKFEWETCIDYLQHKHFCGNMKCPTYRTFNYNLPERAKKAFEIEGYTITGEIITSITPVKLTCPHGHTCEISYSKFTTCLVRCQECQTNKPETDLGEWVRESGFTIVRHYRGLGFELDIYIPELKLAIEYCGLYWHSEAKIIKNYHFTKMRICTQNGIQLITVFEDEYLYKKDILKSIILSKLKVLKKTYAREFVVDKINNKSVIYKFLEENHLQGRADFVHAWALSDSDGIAAVMTFGHPHRDNIKADFILNRLCFKKGINIVGGAERLWQAAKPNVGKVVTFADLRYSTGGIYEKMGFIKESVLAPDYSYMKAKFRYSKQSMRLKPGEIGPELSLRNSQGYKRIWDCGKIRYSS